MFQKGESIWGIVGGSRQRHCLAPPNDSLTTHLILDTRNGVHPRGEGSPVRTLMYILGGDYVPFGTGETQCDKSRGSDWREINCYDVKSVPGHWE